MTQATRFGNPFRVEEHGREKAIAQFEEEITQPDQKSLLADARSTLRGKNLALSEPASECEWWALLRAG